MRVAYYSPLPPQATGVSDYSTLLLPALRERVQVELATPRRDPDADVAVFHVGNDQRFHGWIVDALRRRPGVVVLHEFALHHLVAGVTLGRGDGNGYLRAMERERGLVGRMLALGTLESRLPPIWETRPDDFPLAAEVLDHAKGVIVHSRFVEERVRAAYDGPVWRVPHPAWRPPSGGAEPAHGSPLVGCFGNLNPTKRLPELLAAYALLRERRPEARLLLVGGSSQRYSLPPLPEGVERIEHVPEERLWALMRACDVHVSLRHPTMGETSGSVVRSLSLGKPLVVSDVGWFSELPDDVALKVPVDADEVEVAAGAIELAAAHAASLGAAAAAYAERELELGRVAGLYVRALEEAAATGSVGAAA